MGIIDSRLQKVLQITRQGVVLPIIVETGGVPSQVDTQELSSFMRVRRKSEFVNHVFGDANEFGISSISRLPFVVRVFYDEPVSRFQFAFPSISVSREDFHIPISESSVFVGADKLHDIDITGRGMKVAIIDTGVNRFHPMMKGAVINQINVAKRNGAKYAEDIDEAGHGTHVATTAAGRFVEVNSKILGKRVELQGVAPEADIIDIKVLDDDGSGQTSWVMEGIEEAVKAGADVINMSLGSMFDNAGMSPDSTLVNTITFNKGILFAIAAGNSFANFTIGSPGGSIGALTVASNAMKLPTPGIVSTFSSKGATTDGRLKPDISAPGGNLVNVKETIFAGTSGALAEEAGEEYIGIMGTSMSTPNVSGCLALLLQAGMRRDRFYAEDLLAQTAMYKHPKDIYTGWGMINVKNAYDSMMKGEGLVTVSSIVRLASLPFQPFVQFIPKTEQSFEAEGIRLPYMR